MLGALMLGARIFTIVVSSWWAEGLVYGFCPSSSHLGDACSPGWSDTFPCHPPSSKGALRSHTRTVAPLLSCLITTGRNSAFLISISGKAYGMTSRPHCSTYLIISTLFFISSTLFFQHIYHGCHSRRNDRSSSNLSEMLPWKTVLAMSHRNFPFRKEQEWGGLYCLPTCLNKNWWAM